MIDVNSLSKPSAPPTFEQHIANHQKHTAEDGGGGLVDVLAGIARAAIKIQGKVARAGLTNFAFGEHHLRDAKQQKLDVFTHKAMLEGVGFGEQIGVLASQKNGMPVFNSTSDGARFVIVVDAFDGYSENDPSSVGMVFSVLERPADSDSPRMMWVLQPGTKQVAAGYVMFGSSTLMVCTLGDNVSGFTLDRERDEFVLSQRDIRMPWRGSSYSVDETHRELFPTTYRDYFEELRSGYCGVNYACRFQGALVADFHRTLLHGGVFACPPTDSNPGGKLRLLFEANPLAMIAEAAGGTAIDGSRKVMNIVPKHFRQRSGFVVGGGAEIDLFVRHARGSRSKQVRHLRLG